MALNFHMLPMRDHAIQERVGNLWRGTWPGQHAGPRVDCQARRAKGRKLPVAASSRQKHLDEDDLYGSFSTDLPNDDAAGYVRDLTPVTKEIFDGLSAQYKSDAFTLAGAADLRLIGKIRDALADVAKTAAQRRTSSRGEKDTDNAGVAQLNTFTLDTAFNTAMQRAYSLGRYEQMKDPATMNVLPIWQYWTVGDDRVRPEHAVLDGFAAHADDPVWMKIYPPNGFNCRCTVVPMMAKEAPKGTRSERARLRAAANAGPATGASAGIREGVSVDNSPPTANSKS